MAWVAQIIAGCGMVLLIHACYSAHEFTALHAFNVISAGTTDDRAGALGSTIASAATAPLPSDVVVETVCALLIISVGLVLGTSTLQPIQWNVWAGKVELEGAATALREVAGDNKDLSLLLGNPFQFLDSRPGFFDIRRQRQEFDNWVQASGKAAK